MTLETKLRIHIGLLILGIIPWLWVVFHILRLAAS